MPRKSTTTTTTEEPNEVSYDIISPHSWNIQKHMCGAAKVNKSGQGKSASLTYNKRRFYLKTPKMYCPFGASKPPLKPGEVEKDHTQWSVQLAFGDDAECQIFHTKAEEFDQFMIDEGMKTENIVGWLGGSKAKPFSREVVENKYSNMIKVSKKDGEVQTQYPPFIRAALPSQYQSPFDFTCEIYDKNNELLSASPNASDPNGITHIIPAGCMCSALLSGSIWCNTSGFGVTWRVAQIKIFPSRATIPKGKCLVDDPEEEDEEDEEDEEEEKEKEDDIEEVTEEVVEVDDDEVVEELEPVHVVKIAPKKIVTRK